MGAGLLHMQAKVQPPYSTEELSELGASRIVNELIHEESYVCGGANYRGEIVTAETTARRDQLWSEIVRRLTALEQMGDE